MRIATLGANRLIDGATTRGALERGRPALVAQCSSVEWTLQPEALKYTRAHADQAESARKEAGVASAQDDVNIDRVGRLPARLSEPIRGRYVGDSDLPVSRNHLARSCSEPEQARLRPVIATLALGFWNQLTKNVFATRCQLLEFRLSGRNRFRFITRT